MIFKKNTLALLTLCSTPLFVNAATFASSSAAADDTENWHELSDPRAVYSSVSVAAGNEGVNLSASYGGYLNGLYKHKITVAAMNDLEYYDVEYLLVNASNDSGFSIESEWNRDVWGLTDVNDTAVGVFAKIPLMNKQLNIYPKLNLGMLWRGDFSSTTYVKIDGTTRFSIDRKFWVGVTPTYTYAMQGVELREWNASLDAGVQLSAEFAFEAHVNTESEFWVDMIFTF